MLKVKVKIKIRVQSMKRKMRLGMDYRVHRKTEFQLTSEALDIRRYIKGISLALIKVFKRFQEMTDVGGHHRNIQRNPVSK